MVLDHDNAHVLPDAGEYKSSQQPLVDFVVDASPFQSASVNTRMIKSARSAGESEQKTEGPSYGTSTRTTGSKPNHPRLSI